MQTADRQGATPGPGRHTGSAGSRADPAAAPGRAVPRLLAGSVALAVLALLLTGCGPETPQLANGTPAPTFTLERLAGGTASFPAGYQGQVVAIRFWADWCPFCKDEMRALEPVYRKLQGHGFHILAVNVRQDAETAASFVRKLGITYETLLDGSGAVARAYGVQGLPTTFFVDGQGTLRGRILGESSPEVTERMVSDLLAQRP
jgi:cytochrome c biogenesis protein CcmG, thiol:disulfide interchange protein DsbE